MGKDFQDFKRKQEEEKTKRLLEERNREQVEEKAARERVKQQIALVSLSFSLLQIVIYQGSPLQLPNMLQNAFQAIIQQL